MSQSETVSNKFRRIPVLTKIICEALDSQEIRRLCRYFSLDPLSEMALDYNNEFVEQPDLMDSLLEIATRDKFISRGSEKVVVMPQRFSKEVITDSRVIIFVYCSDVDLRETSIEVDHEFRVDICYPLQLERLEDFNFRQWEILIQLSNALDEYRVKKPEYVKKVGNVEFKFNGNVVSGKLANNSDMGILSVPISVRSMGIKAPRII